MKRITVTDSNIFIDLFKSELIDHFFRLDFQVITSYSVLEELYDHQKAFLLKKAVDKRLEIHYDHIEPTSLEFSKKLSDVDKTLLQISYNLKAILLTGERLMTKWCERHKVESHGILWVLDRMVVEKVLDKPIAINKLTYIRTINLWLPTNDCEDFIKKWNDDGAQ